MALATILSWVPLVVDHFLQMYVLAVVGGLVDHQELHQLARLRDVLGTTMNPGYMFLQVVGIRDR